MSLSDIQWMFLQDTVKLINKAKEMDFKITGGELYRTQDQQQIYYDKGKSKTMRSKHLKRLAIDLNFFIKNKNGKRVLTYKKENIQKLGDYWESLNLDGKNEWGGNWSFKDTNHFQRNF